jgi:hypothetical protein
VPFAGGAFEREALARHGSDLPEALDAARWVLGVAAIAAAVALSRKWPVKCGVACMWAVAFAYPLMLMLDRELDPAHTGWGYREAAQYVEVLAERDADLAVAFDAGDTMEAVRFYAGPALGQRMRTGRAAPERVAVVSDHLFDVSGRLGRRSRLARGEDSVRLFGGVRAAAVDLEPAGPIAVGTGDRWRESVPGTHVWKAPFSSLDILAEAAEMMGLAYRVREGWLHPSRNSEPGSVIFDFRAPEGRAIESLRVTGLVNIAAERSWVRIDSSADGAAYERIAEAGPGAERDVETTASIEGTVPLAGSAESVRVRVELMAHPAAPDYPGSNLALVSLRGLEVTVGLCDDARQSDAVE